jgi:hypothetical protein
VRAIDAAGNVEPKPSEVTWTVDTTPPQTTIAKAPARLVASAGATVWFRASEPGATFQCSVDGGAFVACRSPVRLKALRDRRHTILVRATDAAGNVDRTPADAAWTSDTTAPQTTIAQAPRRVASTGPVTVWVSAGERGARLQCSLDGAAFTRCASPIRVRTLRQGPHALRIRAIDAAGNADRTPAVATWTTDTTPPDTRVVKGPKPTTKSRSAKLWFASTERGSRFQCSLDGRSFGPCRSPLRYSDLEPGSHTLRVRAVDPAGNIDPSPATRTWEIR